MLRKMTINYRIQEVKVKDYIQCLEPLYAVLEKKNKSKSEVDPFMKTILASHGGMTIEQWDAAEKQRLYEKALSMGMGTFHENLMGKFKDYETLPQGHSTGVDVISEKHNELWEVKNRDNTMNSGSGETVVRKLMKVVEEGKKAILVYVTSEKKKLPRFKAPESIIILNGRQAYAHLSGRESFYDDLLMTISDTFARFKTYAELLKGTEQFEVR